MKKLRIKDKIVFLREECWFTELLDHIEKEMGSDTVELIQEYVDECQCE